VDQIPQWQVDRINGVNNPKKQQSNEGKGWNNPPRLQQYGQQSNEYIDEVWVPTQFVKQVYLKSGVNPNKIQVIGEAFHPKIFHPNVQCNSKMFHLLSNTTSTQPSSKLKKIRFLSNFKWEPRKGYDVLLRAFANVREKTRIWRFCLFVITYFVVVEK
ncbi:hypothetical protein RFI_08359, partial [Reticulomyxa filosa]